MTMKKWPRQDQYYLQSVFHISLDPLDVNKSTLEKHIKLMGPSIDEEFQDGIYRCIKIIQFEETLVYTSTVRSNSKINGILYYIYI